MSGSVLERGGQGLNWAAVRRVLGFIALLSLLTFSWLSATALCEERLSDCSAAVGRWKAVADELQEKLKEFNSIKGTPVENIIKRPLVDRGSGHTISKQIAQALQVKEDLLNEKRKECRNLLAREEKAFAELEVCVKPAKNSKIRDVKQLEKKREKLVKDTIITVAEVREVKGSEDYAQYYDPSRPGFSYSGGPGSYWERQQEMFMRYWRYWGR